MGEEGKPKAKRPGRAENLVRLTTEKAREIGIKGAAASTESRQKRKLMSQMYAEFLAKKHDIKVLDVIGKDGKPKYKVKSVTGEALIDLVARGVLMEGGSPAVSMLKEIREATEGSKVKLDGAVIVMATSHDEAL